MDFVALERLFGVRFKGNTIQSLREYHYRKGKFTVSTFVMPERSNKKKMLGFYQNYSEELLTK